MALTFKEHVGPRKSVKLYISALGWGEVNCKLPTQKMDSCFWFFFFSLLSLIGCTHGCVYEHTDQGTLLVPKQGQWLLVVLGRSAAPRAAVSRLFALTTPTLLVCAKPPFSHAPERKVT